VRDAKGNPAELIGVTRDITNRKRAEQERSSAMRNSISLEGSRGLAVSRMMKPRRKCRYHRVMRAFMGCPRGTLEISRDEWRALMHPDDLPGLSGIADHALSDGETEFVLEFRILRHAEVRWIESRVLMSYNELGRPVRRTGANIDVTERKRAEERQRSLIAELDHRVKNTRATVSAVISHTRQAVDRWPISQRRSTDAFARWQQHTSC
jgi:PAS domain-containing protein